MRARSASRDRPHASTSPPTKAERATMRSAVLALAAAFTSSVSCAFGQDLACEGEMLPAANKHGMPLGMLYAVGLTETGRGDSLQPYALNIEGRAVYAIDKPEALRQVQTGARPG